MKKYFVFFALFVVLCSSCGKEDKASISKNGQGKISVGSDALENLAISVSKDIPFQVDSQKIEKWSGHVDLINNQSINDAVLKISKSSVRITGWFADTVQGLSPSKAAIYFKGGTETFYAFIPLNAIRTDVGEALKKKELANSGFNVVLNVSTLPTGKYEIGFLGEANGFYGRLISGITIEK